MKRACACANRPTAISSPCATMRRRWAWYRNRVIRVVLVFMLTNFGTIAGEWLAGARIIGKLVH